MGLCLLGLISVVILPIIASSLNLSNKNFQKAEISYVGEMVVENLKAFQYGNNTPIYISNTEVEEIIDLLKLEKTSNASLDFKGEYGDYRILIDKKERCSDLWEIIVSVDYAEEGGRNSVKFKALLHSK